MLFPGSSTGQSAVKIGPDCLHQYRILDNRQWLEGKAYLFLIGSHYFCCSWSFWYLIKKANYWKGGIFLDHRILTLKYERGG